MVIEGSKVIYESQFLKERERERYQTYIIFLSLSYILAHVAI